LPVLEKILEQHPRYQSAEFMLAAAYGCAGRQKRALAGFEKICQTSVGPVLAVTFYDLARRLKNANQIDYALSLLEIAADCSIESEDINKLWSECRSNENMMSGARP
jgi:tetratricopeptide (TPR) repeat protein